MPPDLDPHKRQPAISQELAQRLTSFKGQWVAIDETKMTVVGSGESAAIAVEAAVTNGFTDPLVFRVPHHARRLRIR